MAQTGGAHAARWEQQYAGLQAFLRESGGLLGKGKQTSD